MHNIAFLGLGIMGQGMVANLLKAGYPTTVWNRSPERCLPFVAQGAKLAHTPKEAAQSADVILYCLADDAAVEQVVFGPSGVLEGVRAGQVAVNMTTQSPALSLREAAAYQAKGVDFLDAPVFGSKNEAAQAGLWIVVGGEREVLERVRPILQALSASIHYMGEHGKGAAMKLAGNLIVASQLHALGEAMVLATKAGLHPVRRAGCPARDRFQVADLRGRRRGADRAQLRDLLCAQAHAEGCQPDRALRRAIERADSRIGGHSGNYQGCGESWLGRGERLGPH